MHTDPAVVSSSPATSGSTLGVRPPPTTLKLIPSSADGTYKRSPRRLHSAPFYRPSSIPLLFCILLSPRELGRRIFPFPGQA